ncbi:universal stress protein [Algiphilus sp.]|uniref:universal stress protein n=1 Tax=Algiphilus sp. TaxID=1872431 RepID=UPI002A5EDF29|nr:universal stress protein [Pseudomonadota bacterium]
MNRYRRIVVATDLSPTAEAALATAVQLARRDDAQLHVLHVRSAVQSVVSTTFGIDDPASELLGDRALRAWIRSAGFEEEVSVMRVIAGGHDAAPQILHYARDEGADLIVLGQRGHYDRAIPFLGDEAHEVLREAPCDVLVTRGRREDAGAVSGIKRILAPVDLSTPSAEALHVAAGLAARLGAGLTVFLVLEPLALPPYLPLERLEKDNATHAAAALERFIEDAHLPVQHQRVIERGTPHRCIADYARREKADLIVMGRAGLGRVERLFLGSVTERVLRTTPCAVLVHQDLPAQQKGSAALGTAKMAAGVG